MIRKKSCSNMPFRWQMIKTMPHEPPGVPGSNYLWFFGGDFIPVVWTGAQFELPHAPGERVPVMKWRFKRDPFS